MNNKIVQIVKNLIGQQEIKGNQGFVDKAFDKRMREVGFYTGAAWCGFVPRLAYHETNDPALSLLSGSAVKTMKLAAKAGNFHTYPVPGAVAVWRTFKNGKPQQTGHLGTVVGCGNYAAKDVPKEGTFSTVEGNTNASGGREGKEVALKTRTFSWTREDGLRLMGFVHPENNA